MPTQKSKEYSRLFPGTGTTGTEHACVQSIKHFHPPISPWTKLLASSCSAAHCADFLLWRVLDREILGHTLLQLARPLAEKSSRPQSPILVSGLCHPRELHLPRIPSTLLSRDTHDHTLCFVFQSWSGVLSPNIPKLTHMLASPH